jgi:ElaB/YqjD/DUF883 family membrane-anchored ribosome-binding protein
MSPTSDRLGKQAGEVTKDLEKMGGIVRDAAEEKLSQMRESTAEYYEHGRDKVHDVVGIFEQFVREQPFKSVLIAAGFGWLLGRFGKRS